MAKDLKLKFVPYDRTKIKVGMLITNLQDHVQGLNRMSATRVRAAEILLKKVMPDLQSLEHKGETTENVRYVAEMPEKSKSTADWLANNPAKPSKPSDAVH